MASELEIAYFLSGAIMSASFVAGLFFLRFWRRTQDRLFAAFSIAFFMLAVERIALLFFGQNDETKTMVYLIRFAAFALLIYAIIDKNRSVSGPRG